jgi:hypothetical protein
MKDMNEQGLNSAPADMIIPIKIGDFPDLADLKEGATITFEGKAQLVQTDGEQEGEGGGMGLQVVHIDVKPEENEADSELDRMTKTEEPSLSKVSPTETNTKGF